MSQLDAIYKTICFIETHLMDPISVADMATEASYSLYHFCRVFGKRTRHSPHDYLIRRRMTKAADQVIHTDRKLIDIALDYQFESHEGFTRAFGRVFTISPSEARQKKQVKQFRTLPRLTYQHLVCLKQQNYLPATIQEDWQSFDNEANCTIHLSDIEMLPLDKVNYYVDVTLENQSVDKKNRWCTVAEFALSGDNMTDLKQIMDWVLHAWLFFAPYELLEPRILLQKENEMTTQLFVPIN